MLAYTLFMADRPQPDLARPQIQLHHGDCLEVMPTLAAGSVGFVFADLPYGITSCDWDKRLDIVLFWHVLNAVCQKNSTACFTGTQPFTSHLVTSNIQSFKYDLIWHKVSSSGQFAAKHQPMRNHEHILLFRNGKGFYNPQMVPGRKYAHSGSKFQSAWYNKERVSLETRGKGSFRYPKSILKFDEQDLRTDTLHGHVSSRIHPTQKPVALLEWLIKTYTNPGDTVLDPCFGSNTTGVACKRLGRGYIGIEKDKAYFEAGKARMEAEPWATNP